MVSTASSTSAGPSNTASIYQTAAATSNGSSSAENGSTSGSAAETATATSAFQQDGQLVANGGSISCNGCQLSLEETSDTVVVSFGEGLWHVDCRCAKCSNLVEHDTNLLLLADGSPVCESCSYVCSYCGQSISNEAIVTGDESYHADCFRCKACSTRIEELVFAKTSQGIYCMACHNERVARTRKHAESKRNRSLRRNQRQGSSGQSSSTRSRTTGSSSTRADQHASASSPNLGASGNVLDEFSTGGASESSRSLYLDKPTSANGAGSPSSGHGTAHMQSRSKSDGESTSPLPEPPMSLKKLRGMDKSPKYSDRGEKDRVDGTHLNAYENTSLRNSPRMGPEALYTSPSPASDQPLPLIDESAERSGSFTSIENGEPSGTRGKTSNENIPQILQSSSDSVKSAALGQSSPSRPTFPALNVSRSVSPVPSNRSPSPHLPSTSPVNTNFTQISGGGLAAPRANASKNANRRSGFYGIMSLPAKPDSPTGSGTTTPILRDEENLAEHTDRGYFDGHSQSARKDSGQGSRHSDDETMAEEKSLPVQPLAITRSQNGTPKHAATTASSSSMSSVNTSAAGSSSSLSVPSINSTTPHTLSASSSSGKNKHMSFYDPDVLVFLDAVNDGSGQKRALSTLNPSHQSDQHISVDTHTRQPDSGKSLSSTMAQDGYSSDAAPDTTLRNEARFSSSNIRSRSLSPNPDRRFSLTPSPRQPRDLNLVANGHISTFSASTHDDDDDDDEERELLSPLATRRRSSNANGLGLSTAGSQRSQKSGVSMVDGEDEEDESTKTALKKVRESIRQSRGASIVSSPGEVAARGSGMTLDIELVEVLIKELEQTKNRMKELQKNYNAIRRASRQAFEGFSMAREEYDREVQARREAEYEMMRLKTELQEQAAKLSDLNEAKAQHERLQRQSRDLRSSVVDIEQELRRMRIERDLTFAEMEELNATAKTKADVADIPERLSVALDSRLSSIKNNYRNELEDMTRQRDNLRTEIEELQQAKDLFTDEGNELNKRNADLSDDIADALKQLEAIKAATAIAQSQLATLREQAGGLQQQLHASSSSTASPASKQRTKAVPPPSRSDSVPKPSSNLSSSANSGTSTPRATPSPIPSQPTHTGNTPSQGGSIIDAQTAAVVQKIDVVAPHATVRKFKWGSKKGLERPLNASISKHPAAQRTMPTELSMRRHDFQPISILRPVRCESCSDKMWGMGEQRCHACGIYCHSKCAPTFNIICNSAVIIEEPDTRPPGAMSMFGNDLVAQCLNENRLIPILVVKCIDAVEASGMEYEGIYRKSGGMGQTKLISACFDRGDQFDLEDQDRFNDISAITSVLKNYFRQLPNPLFTFEFHQDFCDLPAVKDADARLSTLENLLHSLPEQHFATLRALMLHLNRIHRSSAENKMTPANLGVVFGPTLLRSPDPSQEFSQMHLKARVIELTVEHAPQLFAEPFDG